MPHYFGEAPSSDLSNGAFEAKAQALGWPDREHVGMLVGGVHYRADLNLPFVFWPYLTSLGFASVEKELMRPIDQRFYGLHRLLPFAPGRFLSQGPTSRKHEQISTHDRLRLSAQA